MAARLTKSTDSLVLTVVWLQVALVVCDDTIRALAPQRRLTELVCFNAFLYLHAIRGRTRSQMNNDNIVHL